MNSNRIKKITTVFAFSTSLISGSIAQQVDSISLKECFNLVNITHPIAEKDQIFSREHILKQSNLKKNWLPQLNILAQANIQSEVTEIPVDIPGFQIESLSKDQYSLKSELNQMIYDGGTTKNLIDLEGVLARISSQSVEIELYELKDLLVDWFFGIQVIDANILQLDLISSDIDNNINRTKAEVQNGVILKSNLDILMAEKLSLEQKKTALYSDRKAIVGMLSILINQDLREDVVLINEALQNQDFQFNTLERPELELFKLQKEAVIFNNRIRESSLKPRMQAFFQGGYGRPTLNFLKNDFGGYYLAGLSLHWSISEFYKKENDRQLNKLQAEKINTNEKIFRHNLDIKLQQVQSQIEKYREFIERDREIVELRQKIRQRAQAQYENGVTTASDYLHELHQEEQANVALKTHELELQKAIEKLRITIGNNH